MFVPSYFSDPHIQYLHQILEEIDSGTLLVPRFQRPLVWEVDQQLELLRSVRHGIPFGSIMIWRTSRDDISRYESFGRFRLPPPSEGSPRQYIMDGIQRLSTLYAALREPSLDAVEGEPDFEFFFDLKTDDFTTAENIAQAPYMLPLRILLRSVPLIKFQRSFVGDLADAWIEASDSLAEAFRQYKIPVIPIVTEDLEMATQTLQLINRQGTRMSDLHMVHTLTFSSEFDLLQKIEDLKSDVFSSLGWGEVDDEWILNTCKACLGMDMSKTNAKDLSVELKRKPEILEHVASSLKRAILFLRERCGVPSPYMVPYAYQLILLADAFRVRPEPGEEVEKLLEGWFWLTTMGGSFAGISGYRLGLVAKDLRSMVRRGRPLWSFPRPFTYTPLPDKVDFKAVRIKGLALRLASRQQEAGTRVLIEQRNRALLPLFPASKVVSRRLYSSPGNRVLVNADEINSIREKALEDPKLLPDDQIITDQARSYLYEDDHDSFIKTRKRDLEQEERAFIDTYKKLFGFETLKILKVR